MIRSLSILVLFSACAVSKPYMKKQTAESLGNYNAHYAISDITKKASTIGWTASSNNKCYSCEGDDFVQDVNCIEIDCNEGNTKTIAKKVSRKPSITQESIRYLPLKASELSIPEPHWVGSIVYVDRDQGTGIPLEIQTGSVKAKGGMFKAKTILSLSRGTSSVRALINQGLQFIFKAKSNAQNPQSIITLMRLSSDTRERTLVLAKVSTGSVDATIRILPFEAEQYGTSSYLITLKDLEEGEYGFSVSDDSYEMYLFGIDASNDIEREAIQPEIKQPIIVKKETTPISSPIEEKPVSVPEQKLEASVRPQKARGEEKVETPTPIVVKEEEPAIEAPVDDVEELEIPQKPEPTPVIAQEEPTVLFETTPAIPVEIPTEGYFVQLASLSSYPSSYTLYQKAARYGSVYAFPKERTVKIKVGVFSSRSEAITMLKNIRSLGFSDAFLSSDILSSGSYDLLIK